MSFFIFLVITVGLVGESCWPKFFLCVDVWLILLRQNKRVRVEVKGKEEWRGKVRAVDIYAEEEPNRWKSTGRKRGKNTIVMNSTFFFY